ncbi:beta-galactosidase [Anaerocolumna cellulosilytica]|uniref:beta-galactosidase n=1 Tax=Anaerocolumna cellulosilytica TaxID=433286 RepID=A0A6S6R4J8_9FIRM|nr:glycoside hydrolase family 2 TIM barrel-domain containing protein [Anaerocolumna cellulosilytica]MBB5194708.1 hypothetical protein [Anaerocolumna cellulosilytica]BCJ94330.1 beta-galactosidase [Anaerocolumna cellulosilytica]
MGENYYVPEGSHESFHPVLNVIDSECIKVNETKVHPLTAPSLIFSDVINLPSTTEISKKGQFQIDKGQKAHLSRVYPFTGKCYYRRRFSLPEDMTSKGLKLILERTKFTAIYFDGVLVSESYETLIPQEHILSRNATAGEHEILIAVDNHLTEYKDFPACLYNGHQFTEHTQTNWNGIMGRIYLESCQGIYEANFRLKNTGTLQNYSIEAIVDYTGATGKAEFTVDIKELGISEAYQIVLQEGKNYFDFELQLPETVHVWDEFHTNLYEVSFGITKDQVGLISQRLRTGFLKVMTKGRKILVNDKKIFLRGTIDCAIYPLTGAAPMTKEEWLKIFNRMKEYGLNHYRFHSWCPPEGAFMAADELGIYLQIELPFFAAAFTGEEGNSKEGLVTKYIYDQAVKVIDTYGNHPSFLMFAIGNEMTGELEAFDKVLAHLKTIRSDILYSQGSNNFLETPVYGTEDQYWITMRTAMGGNNIRASFSHGDLPLGHIQGLERLGTNISYENALLEVNLPIISHEIGQYETYPDINEVEKYTGVTRSTALELWKEKIKEKGRIDKCGDYLKYSGALAARCYQEDIEAIIRTEGMSGFQLLSLQDFPGQGTALIGILNSFLEEKGVVSPEEFRRFCDARVLFAKLPYYTYLEGDIIPIEAGIFNYGEASMPDSGFKISLMVEGAEISNVIKDVTAPTGQLTKLPIVELIVPKLNGPAAATILLTYRDLIKEYPVWLYPSVTKGNKDAYITSELNAAALSKLEEGKNVVLFSDSLPDSIEAGFTTDFWSYPMFKSICESKNRKPAPGTMGLVIDNTHKALELFPTEKFASWQWQQIITKAKPVILDKEEEYQLIVEVIDNFERGHTLGLLYEKKYKNGTLLVCTADLPKHLEVPEIRQLYFSILNYV